MPFRLTIIALGLLLTLSGCSSTKLAYNFGDWAVEWKVSRFVSLHGDQKDDLKRTIGKLHQWHRSTQLPQYADYLTELEKRIGKEPLTSKDVHRETDRIQLLLDQSLEQALPEVQRVVAALTDEQVQEILKNVAEEREEYIEEHVEVSDKKRAKERYKKFEDQAERWFGRLSREQKTLIKDWSASVQPYEALNAKQHAVWQKQLATLMSQRNDADRLAKGLRELMFYRTDNWLPELEKVLDHNQEITYGVVAQLINGLSDKQEKHFREKLLEYATICRELAAE